MDRTACCDVFQIAGQGQGNTTSTANSQEFGRLLYPKLCVERERKTTKGSTSSKGATKEVWSQRRGKMTRAVRFKQADLLWNKEYFWNYYGARREVYSTRVIRALPGVSQVMSSNFDLVAEEKIESETVTKKWRMPLR